MKTTVLLSFVTVLALGAGACEQRAEKKAEMDTETAEESTAKPEPPLVQAEELIWVFQARGNRQCEGGGISLEQSNAKLTGNGVEVQESRCGTRSDRMYPAVCGGPTGDILLHLISQESLDAALELGFDPADQIQYQQRGSCPGNEA